MKEIRRVWTLSSELTFLKTLDNYSFYNRVLKEAIVAIICQLDELTWVQLSSNPWIFLGFILEQNLEWSLEWIYVVAFLSPNKLIDDNSTLIFWTHLKLPKSRKEKGQGLLLSCTPVNSSSRQIIATNDLNMITD